MSTIAAMSTLEETLAFIPAKDRDTWVRIGMAIKSELGDAGFELWNSWSKTADNYNEQNAKAVWQSLSCEGGVTIGTLLYEAQQYGFQLNAKNRRFLPSVKDCTERDRRAREAATKKMAGQAQAGIRAEAIWKAAKEAPQDHPYLASKGIAGHGLRLHHDGRLIVSLWSDALLRSLQFIAQDGSKQFLSGGRVKGCFFNIGRTEGTKALCICEGYATGASIYESSGYPVVVALHADNLKAVALALRKENPDAKIIICADNDIRENTKENTGVMSGTAAAKAIEGFLAIPSMGSRKCDFNELHRHMGTEAVLRSLREAVQLRSTDHGKGDPTCEEWPPPSPLLPGVEAVAYPLDALPEIIREAVEEVHRFTKAPISIVASSALAAVSLAAQAHIDVKRADKLIGPTGLFLLTVADSGERKSTCDGFFSSPIRDYDHQQAERVKPEKQRHEAAFGAWGAERDGLLAAIKQAAKSGKPADALHERLAALMARKPPPLRVPKLMRGDDTPENLAFVLAREWPSVGVLTAEAGILFGSHAMGTDSIMRNMALLNTLWDGGTHIVGRRTSESFAVCGARLTLGLQIQEATLRSFFDRSRGLARGTGFLARVLFAWPESTQGSRPFTDPPDAWPALEAFHRRIGEVLKTPVTITDEGALSPAMLSLSVPAKVEWVAFHDDIEVKLGLGGELYDVRDVASKTADNAARLGALFHILCSNCSSSNISVEHIASARRIVAWHLNESRRFFGELGLPAALIDSVLLDAWLIAKCRQERTNIVPFRVVQQFGPHKLRQKTSIEAVMRELNELNRSRLIQEGTPMVIEVNPALLSEGAP